jgi:hypothetical protein
MCLALAAACTSPPEPEPWEDPVDGAVAITAWVDDGTPTAPFGPGGSSWSSPQQIVDALAQALARGDATAVGMVVGEQADGTAVGWVRITVADTPVIAADLRFQIRWDGDAWAVARTESRDHCSRPLTDGECR